MSPEQAQEAEVESFRWGFLKLTGEHCLHEIRGYDRRGHLAYRAHDERAAQCNPFPVHSDRAVA